MRPRRLRLNDVVRVKLPADLPQLIGTVMKVNLMGNIVTVVGEDLPEGSARLLVSDVEFIRPGITRRQMMRARKAARSEGAWP